jgi:hypothetical protein
VDASDPATLAAIRTALQHAMAERAWVTVVLRPDLSAGRPVRTLEGIPVELGHGRDGRERVFLGVSDDTQQVVLLERIVRVLRATP